MADSESAALTGLGDTPVSGAVGETRTLMTLATATSRLRVYQFRHDRILIFSSQISRTVRVRHYMDAFKKKQAPKRNT